MSFLVPESTISRNDAPQVAFVGKASCFSQAWGNTETVMLATISVVVFLIIVAVRTRNVNIDTLFLPWIIAIGIWFFWRRFPSILHAKSLLKSKTSINLKRVAIIGTPELINDLGGFQDVPFEPEVIRIMFGRKLSKIELILIVLLIAPCSLLLFWLVNQAAPGFRTIWYIPGYLMAFLVVVGMVDMLFPTMLEIMPGRLEVWRGHAFNPNLSLQQGVDLRTSEIELHFYRKTLFVKCGSVNLDFCLSFNNDSIRSVYLVLLGCLSSHEAPRKMLKKYPGPNIS